MKPQPNPCPLYICQELLKQRRNGDVLEWYRQCQVCGRELVATTYKTEELHKPSSTEAVETKNRWKNKENRGQSRSRRRRRALKSERPKD